MKKVKWGILGAASIAVRRVIPGMQKGAYSEIAAIASRDKKKAEEAARKLGIPKVHGSYEELLQDREIEAIYNPLPIICTCRGRSRQRRQGSTCCAKSPSASPWRRPRRCLQRVTVLA